MERFVSNKILVFTDVSYKKIDHSTIKANVMEIIKSEATELESISYLYSADIEFIDNTKALYNAISETNGDFLVALLDGIEMPADLLDMLELPMVDSTPQVLDPLAPQPELMDDTSGGSVPQEETSWGDVAATWGGRLMGALAVRGGAAAVGVSLGGPAGFVVSVVGGGIVGDGARMAINGAPEFGSNLFAPQWSADAVAEAQEKQKKEDAKEPSSGPTCNDDGSESGSQCTEEDQPSEPEKDSPKEEPQGDTEYPQSREDGTEQGSKSVPESSSNSQETMPADPNGDGSGGMSRAEFDEWQASRGPDYGASNGAGVSDPQEEQFDFITVDISQDRAGELILTDPDASPIDLELVAAALKANEAGSSTGTGVMMPGEGQSLSDGPVILDFTPSDYPEPDGTMFDDVLLF